MKPQHEHSAGFTTRLSALRATGCLPGAPHSPPQFPKSCGRRTQSSGRINYGSTRALLGDGAPRVRAVRVRCAGDTARCVPCRGPTAPGPRAPLIPPGSGPGSSLPHQPDEQLEGAREHEVVAADGPAPAEQDEPRHGGSRPPRSPQASAPAGGARRHSAVTSRAWREPRPAPG